jgi:hypothetical protein
MADHLETQAIPLFVFLLFFYVVDLIAWWLANNRAGVLICYLLTGPGRINAFRRQEDGITQAYKPSQAVILVSQAPLNDPSPSQFQGVVLTRLARSEPCPKVRVVGLVFETQRSSVVDVRREFAREDA